MDIEQRYQVQTLNFRGDVSEIHVGTKIIAGDEMYEAVSEPVITREQDELFEQEATIDVIWLGTPAARPA